MVVLVILFFQSTTFPKLDFDSPEAETSIFFTPSSRGWDTGSMLRMYVDYLDLICGNGIQHDLKVKNLVSSTPFLTPNGMEFIYRNILKARR